MRLSRTRRIVGIALTAAAVTSGASISGADPSAPDVDTFVSSACLSEIEDVREADAGSSEAKRFCTVTTTASEGPTTLASASAAADSLKGSSLGPSDRAAIMAAAAAGTMHTSTFNHSYWGGSIREVHTGRFYWDGSRAWMATYRGKTGYHQCHAAGSIGVGQVATLRSCNKPKAGSSATAAEVFDVDVIFKGSPVKYTVGLYYKKAANGGVSTWQVGG